MLTKVLPCGFNSLAMSQKMVSTVEDPQRKVFLVLHWLALHVS